MISDRIIEQGTLRVDGKTVSVEVRMPWYRALPASCIAGATLTVDGADVPKDTLTWAMNGRVFTFNEMRDNVDEWWFPVDSAILSGALELPEGQTKREVTVTLVLYIPYIIISDTEVLHIEEQDTKSMQAVAA